MEKQIKKINIGLDIGVASVGYSIIDENYNILKLGVRLFDDVRDVGDGTLKNATRREKRGSRRRIRRISTRKESYKRLLKKFGYANTDDDIKKLLDIDITKFGVENPVELKVKALKEKIPVEQLLFILFHYLHHRGFFYIKEDDYKGDKIDNSNIFPSKELYDFYKKNGYYKNSPNSNNYSHQQYWKEIDAILKVNNNLNKEFINEYKKLFSSCRDFSQGPGSEKSPSKYGLYRLDKDGKVKKEFDNLWDGLIGKCTYYKDELRGAKNSPISEIFNLLNDISNIYFFHDRNNKLTKQDKEIILDNYNKDIHKNKDYQLLPKELVKIKENYDGFENITENDVFGYRTETKNKELITNITNYKSIFNFMISADIIDNESNMWDINIIEKAQDIFKLLQENDVLKRKENVNEKYPKAKEFVENLVSNVKKVMETHSLSYKAMIEYINYSLNNLDENKNQMIFFNEKMIKNENKDNTNKFNKYLPHNLYEDAIISPTAKRAFKQTINVLNKILKKYSNSKEYKYCIDNITIELARDKNIFEEKKSILKANDKNKKMVEDFKKEFNLPENTLINSSTKLRIKLWKQQEGRDIYDNSEITYEEIMNGINLDIDHIIPFSISADDSINNKVLTHSKNNKDKSDLTPYQWLEKQSKFDEFEKRVKALYAQKTINKEKYNNLIYKGDPKKDPESFIGRHLSDTRYASRLTLNMLQDFFDKQKIYGNVKVKTIRGQITNFARYNLFVKEINGKRISMVPKNRDLYCHHAIDASIICFLGMNHKTKLLLNKCNEMIKTKTMNDGLRFDNNRLVDDKTGEVVEDVFNILNYNEHNDNIVNFGSQLESYNWKWDENEQKIIYGKNSHKVLFSRMLVRKNNISLSHELFDKIKWKNENNGITINKIKIFDWKKEDIKKFDNFFNSKEKAESLLLYKDKILFNVLCDIYKNYYKDKKSNPFLLYMNENFPNIEKPNFLLILDENNNIKYKIKNISYFGNEIDKENVIEIKNKKIEDKNEFQYLSSLNWLKILIYKNKNNKFVSMTINQKLLKYDKNISNLKIDEDKLNTLLKNNEIENKKCIKINRGFTLKNTLTNELFYISGYTSNKFELKYLARYKDKEERIRPSLSILVKNYNIVLLDELGNIYLSKSFEKFYDENL